MWSVVDRKVDKRRIPVLLLFFRMSVNSPVESGRPYFWPSADLLSSPNCGGDIIELGLASKVFHPTRDI
jgi:hypothetical protein